MPAPSEAGKLPWHRRLATRVILTAMLAGLVPMLLVGGALAWRLHDELVGQAISTMKTRTGAIRNGVEAVIGNYERQVSLLAATPEIQRFDRDGQLEAMYRFMDLNPLLFSIFVYDASGTITNLAYRNRDRGLDEFYIGRTLVGAKNPSLVAAQQAFLTAVRTGKSTFADQIVTSSSADSMVMQVPIFDFETLRRVIGVLSCAINLDSPELMDIFKNYPLASGDVLLLCDRNGSLITSRGHDLPEGLTGIATGTVTAFSSEPVPITLELTGRPYLGVVTPVSRLQGYLLAARPREEVLGPLMHLLEDLAILLSLGLLLAAGFGALLAHPLAGHLNRLSVGIREVGNGAVTHRLPVEGNDELAETCRAFNDMTATLEKHRLMDEIWRREWNGPDSGSKAP
ncbi:MAG TPA: cache domain-containing protein [Candidatus Ozemobacteraceae bacterium]|nr:cache domain-containing protein [Candidatus Ozemobacteraceae bacterium]